MRARIGKRLDFSDGKKRCPVCKKRKPLECFTRSKELPSGRISLCKPCKAADNKARAARKAGEPDLTAPARFMAKVEKLPNGCWQWTGAKNSNSGHGCFYFEGKTRSVRSVVWELFGKTPPGVGRKHPTINTCGTSDCVNPDHVAYSTRAEINLKHSKLGPFQRNARKTHCEPYGHPLIEGETIIFRASDKSIRRDCRLCYLLRNPGSTIKPNRRSDAVADKSRRLLAAVEGALAGKSLPPEIRDDVRQDALLALLSGQFTVKTIAAKIGQLVTRGWSFHPARAGVVSLDEPMPGADDVTRLDALADSSPYSNPAWAYELNQTTV